MPGPPGRVTVTARRVVLLGICLALLAVFSWRVWDRYERGILYPWVEAMLYEDNPHDGTYVMDPDAILTDPLAGRIAQSLDRDLPVPMITITRHRASIAGTLINSPVWLGRHILEVCLQDDGSTVHLNGTRWGAVRYCHHQGANPVILTRQGVDGLICQNCTDLGLPMQYRLVRP